MTPTSILLQAPGIPAQAGVQSLHERVLVRAGAVRRHVLLHVIPRALGAQLPSLLAQNALPDRAFAAHLVSHEAVAIRVQARASGVPRSEVKEEALAALGRRRGTRAKGRTRCLQPRPTHHDWVPASAGMTDNIQPEP